MTHAGSMAHCRAANTVLEWTAHCSIWIRREQCLGVTLPCSTHEKTRIVSECTCALLAIEPNQNSVPAHGGTIGITYPKRNNALRKQHTVVNWESTWNNARHTRALLALGP
ncbi:hypothetical protein R1flu_026007 [Riccia fluitans]|uniref:Uncharacterized protein n=1 Tax=Riccia fluitans TaxID=41844 RepID=A0ABD1XEQ4_9MARC